MYMFWVNNLMILIDVTVSQSITSVTQHTYHFMYLNVGHTKIQARTWT